MQISNEQKEEIKARIDLADLIASYGIDIRHNGSGIWCRCPFHNEKTPSFKIDPSSGRYHCFGCGESGDAIDFVMKQDGLSFGEAAKRLADKVGIELKAVVNPTIAMRGRLLAMMAELATDFGKMLKAKAFTEADIARAYVKDRDITDEAIAKFQIGYVPKDVSKILGWAKKKGYSEEELVTAGILKSRNNPSDKPYSYFGGRLVFTLKDKYGKVVGFSGRKLDDNQPGGKYVNSPETILFKKSRTMFAFDEARRNIVKALNREAIICEGQIDCIRLHMNGYPTAVAPLGTAFTEEHATMLHRVADSALLCFDDDSAGHKATIKAAAILLAEGMPVRAVSLPDGEDPDSFIRKYGAESFSKLIAEKSESIVRYQIRAEKAKEQDPNDPNATVRISKAILTTLANCKSKIMREALLKEAAKILDLQYKVLIEDIEKMAKTAGEEQVEDAEQFITPPSQKELDVSSNLPSNIEGALIVYLMENEGKIDEEKQLIKALLPKEVFSSSLAVNFLDVWLNNKKDEEDLIRQYIETMPPNEYKAFIALMTYLDGMSYFDGLETKHKIVYFARQIWHDYFLRLLNRVKQLPSSDGNKALGDKITKSILFLNSETVKNIVKFMRTFSHTEFAGLMPETNPMPNGKIS